MPPGNGVPNVIPLENFRDTTVPQEIIGRFFFDPEAELPESLQDFESIRKGVSQKFRSKPTETILEEIDLAITFLRQSGDFATAKIFEDGLREWEPYRQSKPDIFRSEMFASVALAIHAIETAPLQAKLNRRSALANQILIRMNPSAKP